MASSNAVSEIGGKICKTYFREMTFNVMAMNDIYSMFYKKKTWEIKKMARGR